MTKTVQRNSILVRGAGVIGLSAAFELSRRGHRVRVTDIETPGRGASWAAAGMLAPAFEAAGNPETHPDLFALCLEGVRLWGEFADALTEDSGADVGLVDKPSFAVAADNEEAAHLEQIAEKLRAENVEHSRLTGQEARRLEPSLSSSIRNALCLPTDIQVDNRRLVTALLAALAGMGVDVITEPDTSLDVDEIELITIGWRAPGMTPVRGQMLSLAPTTGHPNSVVRCGSIYVAPKADRTVIGATVEPGVSERTVLPKDIKTLRERAAQIIPALAKGEVLETWSGIRPSGKSHAPAIGWLDENRLIAAGHYRNGVLLAPITARWIADLVEGKPTEVLQRAFSPSAMSSPVW